MWKRKVSGATIIEVNKYTLTMLLYTAILGCSKNSTLDVKTQKGEVSDSVQNTLSDNVPFVTEPEEVVETKDEKPPLSDPPTNEVAPFPDRTVKDQFLRQMNDVIEGSRISEKQAASDFLNSFDWAKVRTPESVIDIFVAEFLEILPKNSAEALEIVVKGVSILADHVDKRRYKSIITEKNQLVLNSIDYSLDSKANSKENIAIVLEKLFTDLTLFGPDEQADLRNRYSLNIPTQIFLNNLNFAENSSLNSVVGLLATSDLDENEQFSYLLVSGEGDHDNGEFEISGTGLIAKPSFDYETKNSFSIRVKSIDKTGLSIEQIILLSLENVNEPPSDLVLSNNQIAENSGNNATVGLFSATDPDSNSVLSYTLVSGTGDSDNSFFIINSLSELIVLNSPDFEVKSTYSVRVRVSDDEGLNTEKTFQITVTDVAEGPFPDISSNTGIQIGMGAQLILTDSFLHGEHSVDSDENLLFTLIATPLNGILYRKRTAILMGDTFTQKDIDFGLISYHHIGADDSNDSFLFTLHDSNKNYASGADWLDPETFSITVTDYCSANSSATQWNEIGSGPFIICTEAQMDSIATNCGSGACTANFELRANIDYEGGGLIEINAADFEGVFDGKGHHLANFTLNGRGVFRQIGAIGIIRDIGLINPNVISGIDRIGSLVGRNYGTVLRSYSKSNQPGPHVQGTNLTGGLVGTNESTGTIERSWSNLSPNVTSNWDAGGLVGGNYNVITKSWASGDISTAFDGVGGLVGYGAPGSIVEYSHATGNVSGTENPDSYVGGLVGHNHGIVRDSFATGNAFGYSKVGGLIGRAGTNGSDIIRSFATGNVHTTSDSSGGLIGDVSSASLTISDSYATGTVTSDGNNCGGITSTLRQATILNSYSTSYIECERYAGGIASQILLGGSVQRSYATGAMLRGSQDSGGIVGYTDTASISESYVIKDIEQLTANSRLGGIVGGQWQTLTLSDSFFKGTISTVAGGSIASGLGNCGTNCSASRVYTIGDIVGLGSNLSGFTDNPNGTFSQNFWSQRTPAQSEAIPGEGSDYTGIIGVSTSQLEDPFTFASTTWDFSSIWTPAASGNPPELRNAGSQFCDDYRSATTWNEIGTGPFSICTKAQLDDLAENCNAAISIACDKDFELGWDIHFYRSNISPIGTNTNPFIGSFNGKGFSIRDPEITADSNEFALFRHLGTGGKIENLNLYGVRVNAGAFDYVSPLVAVNHGLVSKIELRSRGTSPHITGSGDILSGLIAHNLNGTVQKSMTHIDVNGNSMIGGIVALNGNDATISRVQARGTVSGASDFGLVVGNNLGSVEHLID